MNLKQDDLISLPEKNQEEAERLLKSLELRLRELEKKEQRKFQKGPDNSKDVSHV